MSSFHDPASDVESALRALVESQYRLMSVMQQNNEVISQAINALTATVASPRRLLMDAAGNPTGVMPVLHP